MKYLFNEWDNLWKNLEQNRIFLFLDYDGTLTPIVDRPEEAILPKRTKEIIRALSGNSQCRIAIVSGRALDDIKRRVGLDNIIYIGNHGLEIYDSKLYFRWVMPQCFKEALDEIKNRLKADFAKIEGVFIEDKKFTLSLHYRTARTDDMVIRRIFDNILSPYQSEGKVTVLPGKKVFEVRPPRAWHKGKAVMDLFLRERLAANDVNIIPIYIGDDETDEDAFKEMVDKKGVTIRVGEDRTSLADYYVNDPDEVSRLLEMILKLKKNILDADVGKR